jgi:TetR/AcrR family transcriptional regulator, mexCD-oprJ operon repressor
MPQMSDASTDHRRATAQRNVEAILDAAESLLERGAVASTTAVAAEAGVSRVTVYSHFPTREALLEALAERAVARFRNALEPIDLDGEEPAAALDRLIAMGWREQDRYEGLAQVIRAGLSSSALIRAHQSLHEPISALIRRGQADGAFRDDLPAEWLLTSYFSLMHACGDEVRAGKIAPADAVGLLQATIRGLFGVS